MPSPRSPRAVAFVLTAAALAAAARPARAVDLTLQLQPGYLASDLTTRDETGEEHHSVGDIWTQKYRLSLDAPLYPLVILNAGGLLDWNLGSTRLDGVESSFDNKRWVGFAHLRLGSPMLSGGLDYDRRDETASATAAGLRSTSPRIVSEAYGASVGWHPVDLPSLDLQLHRTDGYDWTRALVNRTTDDAQVGTRFKPSRPVDLGLTVRGSQNDDRIAGVRTRDLTESVLASYADSYLGGRATAYAAYTGNARVASTSITAAGGTVATLQVPSAGLSIVEAFPAIATQVTLNPNAALIDGNVTASAGLNLGFSASAGGQRPPRDLGAQFPNVVTPVNELYVWVDRQLPADVAASFQWEAYRSDDNITWTAVAITGPVQFGLLQNRFEIPIERTQARYLKVVTRPMASTLTTDPQLSEIFVTEVQFLLLVPAEEARGRSTSIGGSLNASGKLVLDPRIGLTYDASTFITHSDSSSVTWAISNGLSASRRLNRVFRVGGRVDRTDTDLGRGHESNNRWGGSLFVEPIQTFAGAFTYSGQFAQSRAGDAMSQSVGVLARADVYEGISLGGNSTYSFGFNEAHQTLSASTSAATLSLVPNRYVTANAGASFTDTSQRGGSLPPLSDRRTALDLAATLSPFPSLGLSGGVSRFFRKGFPAQTLANFSAAFSPFQGGALSIRYAYQESIDTGADTRTRTHGPALRWNIRQGWFLDSAYSFQDTRSPAQDTWGRAFNTNLTITLH